MKQKRIAVIDGYNVIHKVAEFRKRLDTSLASARQGLVEYCLRWMSTRGDFLEFWIVFDGDSSVMPWSREGGRGVRVIFTNTKEDADDRILALIREGVKGEQYVVVSSDNYVSGNAKTHGAKVVAVADFFGTLAQGKSRPGRRVMEHHSDGLSPVQERLINESLKKEWGLE